MFPAGRAGRFPDGKGALMETKLEIVNLRKKTAGEISAEAVAARELVRLARGAGPVIDGP
ncbi:MAG: hypothetical protein NVSMB43_08340 [Pseudarthrobacter sp.]